MGATPIGGFYYHSKKVVLKDELGGYTAWIQAKDYSFGHKQKLIKYAQKLAIYTHFFSYDSLYKIKDKLQTDCFYKTIKVLCRYFEEKNNGRVSEEIERIRGLVKKPKGSVDIYTPNDKTLLETMEMLKKKNKDIYTFYLGLIFSGVRIRELYKYLQNPSAYKRIENGNYYKIIMNYRRSTKTALCIYLPKWFELDCKFSLRYMSKFLVQNKEILRPKYLRNWFYTKCLELGIPGPIADFYQGRVPNSIGNRHYLDKERLADVSYSEKICDHLLDFKEKF